MSFIDNIKTSFGYWSKDKYANNDFDTEESIDMSSNAVTEQEAQAAFEPEEYTRKTEKRINMHNPTAKAPQIRLIAPKNYEEVGVEVVNLIKDNCAVVLNLNALSNDDRSKIIYFMLGVVAMSEGTMRKGATNTFIVTPKGYNLVGEIEDNRG